jgi:NitT/TauT family transport system substrate-binding protein
VRAGGLGAAAFVALAAASFAVPGTAAENIKIGMVPVTGSGPVYIAADKGYFAGEGLSVEFVNFDASQTVVQAVIAGDVDIGATALSAAFYSLAGKGGLELIGGHNREAPGFHGQGVLASNRAWDAGLTSFTDLAHHSVAIPQTGGPVHYSVALIAEKYGVDMKTVRLLPLQTLPNVASALVGGQPDFGVLVNTLALPLLQRNQAHLLGWVGDETPWQISGLFIATKTAEQRHAMVDSFLRAYRKGARDYYDAFVGPDGKRRDGATADAVLAILAKYLNQKPEQLARGISYVDPEARLDVKDILHQIAWYKSEGMLKSEIDTNIVIDRRYVIPLEKR